MVRDVSGKWCYYACNGCLQNLKIASIANWNWLLRVPKSYAGRSRARSNLISGRSKMVLPTQCPHISVASV